jgi:hypothetical protein
MFDRNDIIQAAFTILAGAVALFMVFVATIPG